MDFVALFSFIMLNTLLPGPNNLTSMANASKYGFKKSYRFNIGIFCGFLVVFSGCVAFSSLLYRYIPPIKPIMLVIGATYILWLAYSIWRNGPRKTNTLLAETNTLRAGLILQFVNVKLILYGITVMSSYILPYYSSVAILAAFVLLLSFIGFVATCCWALFGVAFDRLFKKHGKILNVIMSLALVYCAISMLWELWA